MVGTDMKIYNIAGHNIYSNPLLIRPVENKIKLTTKERIFSLNPWVKYKTIVEMVADENIYQSEDGIIVAHPNTVMRMMDDMGMFGTMH